MNMLSLVLPCRNQADHIGSLIERYLRVLENARIRFELVLVPNLCRDETQAIVERFPAIDSRIRVVVNDLGGWGRSVRMGLDACRGDVLAYTNAARTDPESLPRFVELVRESPKSLIKARRVQRSAPMRELGSFLYNLEARALFGVGGDVNGTPKLFAADFYRSLDLKSTGDLLDLELMSHARRRGLSIREIEVPGFKRHGGKSTTTLASAWKMYVGAVKLRLGAL